MDALTDEIESVLFVCREVMGESNKHPNWLTAVYQVPPRTSVSGYKAAEWNVESFMWKGRLRVLEIGPKCEIKLEVG